MKKPGASCFGTLAEPTEEWGRCAWEDVGSGADVTAEGRIDLFLKIGEEEAGIGRRVTVAALEFHRGHFLRLHLRILTNVVYAHERFPGVTGNEAIKV